MPCRRPVCQRHEKLSLFDHCCWCHTIGEACHIGAPIILIPEKGQIEGELNSILTSHYYDNACTIAMSEVSAKKLTEATSTIEGNGSYVVDGSKEVAQIIDQFLEDYYSNRAS